MCEDIVLYVLGRASSKGGSEREYSQLLCEVGLIYA